MSRIASMPPGSKQRPNICVLCEFVITPGQEKTAGVGGKLMMHADKGECDRLRAAYEKSRAEAQRRAMVRKSVTSRVMQ